MSKTVLIEENDLLRFALAKARCGESNAVCANLQLSLQREATLSQQRQREFDALGAGLRKKYNLSEGTTIELEGEAAGTATDPTPLPEPAAEPATPLADAAETTN